MGANRQLNESREAKSNEKIDSTDQKLEGGSSGTHHTAHSTHQKQFQKPYRQIVFTYAVDLSLFKIYLNISENQIISLPPPLLPTVALISPSMYKSLLSCSSSLLHTSGLYPGFTHLKALQLLLLDTQALIEQF